MQTLRKVLELVQTGREVSGEEIKEAFEELDRLEASYLTEEKFWDKFFHTMAQDEELEDALGEVERLKQELANFRLERDRAGRDALGRASSPEQD